MQENKNEINYYELKCDIVPIRIVELLNKD